MTDAGLEHHMTAHVTDVNKALLSVSKLVSKGCRVVFDGDNCFIENKSSGDWVPLEQRNGLYVLRMWVPKSQQYPF